jgi:predicted DNA binding CopG/RHH family protein
MPHKGVYDVFMRRVNVFLSEQQIASLKALSQRTGITYSEWIRRAIDRLLKSEK